MQDINKKKQQIENNTEEIEEYACGMGCKTAFCGEYCTPFCCVNLFNKKVYNPPPHPACVGASCVVLTPWACNSFLFYLFFYLILYFFIDSFSSHNKYSGISSPFAAVFGSIFEIWTVSKRHQLKAENKKLAREASAKQGELKKIMEKHMFSQQKSRKQ